MSNMGTHSSYDSSQTLSGRCWLLRITATNSTSRDEQGEGAAPGQPGVARTPGTGLSSMLYRTLALGLAGLAQAVPAVVVGTAKTQMAALWSGGF